jgi:hypothetical protein
MFRLRIFSIIVAPDTCRWAARCLSAPMLMLAIVGAFGIATGNEPKSALKTESFERDPGWEEVNNRTVPQAVDRVTQDFGYSSTTFATDSKGEIGGTLWRAVQPAWYAEKITPRTLDDKLSASGTFAITDRGAGGVVFGWFNSIQSEGTSRPLQALGLQIGAGKNGGVLHVRLHTAQNQSAGMLIQPAGQKKAHDAIRNDGTRYTWKLDYDPQAAEGKGRITFTIHSNLATPDPLERETYSIDLPAGYKKQGTVFDRFGMMNLTKPGGQLAAYFGGLEHDGEALDLRKEPAWEAVGNRATSAKGAAGANDFGFSGTNHAGGETGEMGGIIWRTGKQWASYADRVGPLLFDQPLEASGKIMLEVGAPDSGAYFGWFHSGPQEAGPEQAGSFLGAKIAGPSRVGHYFAPAYTTMKGTAHSAANAAILVPGRVYEWTLSYDPSAANGLGAVRATLGDESFTLEMKKGDKAQGGQFDRFGIFSVHNDGGHAPVKIFFDDLKYSAGPRIP